jgi:uncharacterized membrane protein
MKNLFTSISTYIKKHPKTDIAILLLGLAVFATITLINAPRASIWFDEAFSTYLVQFSFWDIAKFTASDVHPPFYYWLLKIWSELFGTTELAYRSLSIVFGAAAISTAFVLARKFFGRKVAWLSLLFLVISPMLIRYSDEARMYTLAAFIVMLGTFFMVKAEETKKTKYWIWYGVMVSLGMWTHYFTAFAWLAHWVWRATQVWRKGDAPKQFLKKFFTKPWIITYSVAVGLFLPWLPFMAKQVGVVQSGFWIGPVGIDTPTNYMTNYFYYLEHGQTQSWLALAMVFVVVVMILAIPKAYKALNLQEKKWFLLVASLSFIPPALLFFMSMPPLRSTFVERYMVPALVMLSIFMAVVLLKGLKNWKPFWRTLPILVVLGMMIFGVTNVYKYGNFNKNTDTHILTRQAVEAAGAASPKGTPIVAASPWVFYEAAPYATEDHPVYFIDEGTSYTFGSLDMLKYSDMHKIKNLEEFKKQNPIFWYLNNTQSEDVAPYQDSWTKLRTIGMKDELTGKTLYKATEYKVTAE